MQPTQDHAAQALVGGLLTILDTYAPIHPGAVVNPADAFFAYRLFLGRHPDRSSELPHLVASSQSFREFLRGLLDSQEYADTGGFPPPHKQLMTEVNGFRFWFDTSDREMGVLMALGKYEQRSVEMLERLLQPGMRCIDAGAQTGFFTCLMADRVGEQGIVYAFEPMPASYQLLIRNVQENRLDGIVQHHPYAVSDAAELLSGSLVSGMYIAGQAEEGEPITMQSIRIDDVVTEQIDVIKLDVEGSEPAAIEGMRSLLERKRPIILTEANERWLRACSGMQAGDYIDLLAALGYDVFDLNDMDLPLRGKAIQLDYLDTINVVALPHR